MKFGVGIHWVSFSDLFKLNLMANDWREVKNWCKLESIVCNVFNTDSDHFIENRDHCGGCIQRLPAAILNAPFTDSQSACVSPPPLSLSLCLLLSPAISVVFTSHLSKTIWYTPLRQKNSPIHTTKSAKTKMWFPTSTEITNVVFKKSTFCHNRRS